MTTQLSEKCCCVLSSEPKTLGIFISPVSSLRSPFILSRGPQPNPPTSRASPLSHPDFPALLQHPARGGAGSVGLREGGGCKVRGRARGAGR